MKLIENQTLDQERALYGVQDVTLRNIRFDGPADGESALKECSDVVAENTFFNLRYPCWHDHYLTIRDSELTEACRASLWYCDHVEITGTKLHGIKALNLSNLRLLNTQKKKQTYTSSKRAVNRSNLDVKAITEVDLRGMTAIEAVMELESAIDSAIMMNMNQITIIHGKGTGVLRNEVHKYLKTCKYVKSYRLGVYGEGEAGVTIAELK